MTELVDPALREAIRRYKERADKRAVRREKLNQYVFANPTFRGIEQNPVLGGLAAASTGAADALSNVEVGFRGNSIGLGEISPFRGAGEVLEDASFGFGPVESAGQNVRLDPRVADVADVTPTGMARRGAALTGKGILAASPLLVNWGRRGAKGAHRTPGELLVAGDGSKPTTQVIQDWGADKGAVDRGIDATKAEHPAALRSVDDWLRMEQSAFGGDQLPPPPFKAVEYANNPALIAEKLTNLRPEFKAAVDEGFRTISSIKGMYTGGTATPSTTGNILSWAFLSRGAGPLQQEGAYITIRPLLQKYIDRAAKGKFDDATLDRYLDEVGGGLPEGSPARQVTHNVNALGEFLRKMGQPLESEAGKSGLQVIHELIGSNAPTKEIRRRFFDLAEKAGIDNKVFSFAMLASGRDDVLVIDRIQARHLWDAEGQFDGKNIYDGVQHGAGKGGLVGLMTGPRGTMVHEVLEEQLEPAIREGYRLAGRPQDASIGRFHWESWLIDGNQAVEHGTLRSIASPGSTGSLAVREGKPDVYRSGGIFMRPSSGRGDPVWAVGTADGRAYKIPTDRWKEFQDFIANPSNGVIPNDFWTVGKSAEGGPRGTAWYNDPRVDRSKLDAAIKEYGTTLRGRDRQFVIDSFRADAPGSGGRYSAADESARAGGARRAEGRVQAGLAHRERLGRMAEAGNAGPVPRRSQVSDRPALRKALGSEGSPANVDVVASYSVSPGLKKSLNAAGADIRPWQELGNDDAARSIYSQKVQNTIDGSDFGKQVSPVDPDDLQNARLFTDADGKAGFAVTDDGEISYLWSDDDAGKGAALQTLALATQEGGSWLNAFDTYLPQLYSNMGFEEVARIPFDKALAPKGWNYEKLGTPDIVFMRFNPSAGRPAYRRPDQGIAGSGYVDYDQAANMAKGSQ